MVTVREPAETVKLICGSQKEKNEPYRLTKLCLQTNCDKGILLYHTLTGELVFVKDDKDIRKSRAELIAKWFYVPDSFDDMKFADKVINVSGLIKNNNIQKSEKKHYTIFTTTDCNARCYYCYEAGVRKITMTEKTAVDTAEYIARNSEKNITLRWFGGEPLYNAKVIDIICQKLREFEIEYSSTMITNGYYLNGETSKKAVELWNLTDVQITLDGTSDEYNRIKAYKDGKDAYDKVIQNIDGALAKGINVHVRLNVSSKNVPDLIDLADELAARFPGREGFSVYASLLSDFKKGEGRFEAENQDAESYLNLVEKLKTLKISGKSKPLPQDIKYNVCRADNDSCEVILPDGRLSRCDHEAGKDCYGSIYKEECDKENIKEWKERVRLPECYDCPLYPLCLNLKKCALVNTHCADSIKNIRISSIKTQMSETYEKWKGKSL